MNDAEGSDGAVIEDYESSAGEVRIFLNGFLSSGDGKTMSKKVRNISPVDGIDLLVEESDMESEDISFPPFPTASSTEEVSEPPLVEAPELLRRCGTVLQEIYALGLDEEVEGEHINVVLRELMDAIDARIAADQRQEQEGAEQCESSQK